MKQDIKNLFADIMQDFQGYTIGKMLKYLNDPSIISFAGGLPSDEVFPKEFIREKIDRLLEENASAILQYAPIPGDQNLMDAIIDYLKYDNILIKPENIMITTSGQHGLDLAGRLFLNPGDYIITSLPTFAGAMASFEMQGVKYASTEIEEDGANVDLMEGKILELLKRQIKPKFIYVVPDFQNPSGITMSLEKRHKLLSISENYDIPIMEDSPYRELRYRGEHIPSIFALDNNRGNVIGLYTFSKILCAGLRVGFNIGPAPVIEKFSFIKGANILCTPKLNQDICAAFLREYDLKTHFENLKKYYREKLDFFLDAMNKHFPLEMGVKWTKPEGGLFLWITVPEEINTTELFFQALEQKVAFVPGEVFYPAGYEKYDSMRINFSYPTKEQLVEGVNRLSIVIKNYKKKNI